MTRIVPIERTAPQKRPRIKQEPYLDFIRSLPSLVPGRRPVEAAHVRYAALHLGKRETGMGEKPHDRWTVPLAGDVHQDQHRHNEREWWERRGIDPLLVCLALFGAYHDGDRVAAEFIVRTAGRVW
ncbi:hypothetical protein [Microbaculum marinum]|uniref:Uncharacterized protein n=1 Tax=Microbaculum marinum TaxID=1764581 RepID=A0AAW9RQW4_9HYPH